MYNPVKFLKKLPRLISGTSILKSNQKNTQANAAAEICDIGNTETRFRTLFEYAPISIWEEDFSAVREYIDSLYNVAEGDLSAYFDMYPNEVVECAKRVRIVDVNRATLKIYGAERKEQLLGDLLKILRPDSLSPFKEQLLGLLHGEVFFENETVNYTLDGQKRNLSVRITVPPEYAASWKRVFVVLSDFTEQRKTEEALRQSEERFKLLAWATKDAVWDWDLKTNQIWWGEGLQKNFHYPPDLTQTHADWWFEHIHPEDLARVKKTIAQALEVSLDFWSKQYRFQRKDGSYTDIMDRGYILRDEKGLPYRMIGAMLDITDIKQMESALLESNEQMRQFLNELQRRHAEIGLLNEMGRLLQASQSLTEVYRIISELSKQLFPETTGAIYLFNSSRTHVRAVASWGQLSLEEQIFSPQDCWALYRGRTQPLKESGSTLSCHHLPHAFPGVSYCLPLQIQGDILGVVHVRSDKKENFGDTKRELAYSVAEHTTMALSNLNLRAALREQSIRDPLTKLYNRRYMEEALLEQMIEIAAHPQPLAIIMIDIDHFKSFNDLYGHAGGDVILRKIGQFLQSHIRGQDIACRYGGEEFLLILPGVSLHLAQRRAEQLRQEATQLYIKDIDPSWNGITLSLGVAAYPLHGRSMDSLLRAADIALYRAKAQGRDQVVIAEKS